MRVHHLNCGTLRPFGRRLINGDGLPFQTGRLVCHCLLIETDRGLVLVDTGFGLGDIARYRPSPSRPFRSATGPPLGPGETAKLRRSRRNRARFLTRPRLDRDETAIRQVARLGFSADDVTDIVLTHLDSDHAGGLADFPGARVHVHEVEYRAAMTPPTSLERFRYWTYQWAHGPDWVTYGSTDGDRWFGFEAVRELQDLPDIALIPLPGHSRGHAGVATRVRDAEAGTGRAGWLLHAGDTYFFRHEIDPVAPRSTPGLARFQARLDVDRSARLRNQARLRELAGAHGDEIEMFCSHDPVEFDRYRKRPQPGPVRSGR
jgi:glyoxylase-like metal-dependent hydrolase (beta-lactamase superfamily II)